MTYSCSDFVDTILDALQVDVPPEDYDSPEAQADLALAAIDQLRRARLRPNHTAIADAARTLTALDIDEDGSVRIGPQGWSILQKAFAAERRDAASPEMLEALRLFVRWNDEDRGTRFLEDALNAARAAIAKAGG